MTNVPFLVIFYDVVMVLSGDANQDAEQQENRHILNAW